MTEILIGAARKRMNRKKTEVEGPWITAPIEIITVEGIIASSAG